MLLTSGGSFQRHFVCRYVAGQKEYEVELQFNSDLLEDNDEEDGDVYTKTPAEYKGSSTTDLQRDDQRSAGAR